MPGLHYLNFDLLIGSAGAGYLAHVLASPAGEASAPFAAPFSDTEVEDLLARMAVLQRPRRGQEPLAPLLKQFGARLFDAVFSGEVRTCLRRSQDEAGRQGAGLRLRLRLADVPELASLPWEYLYQAGNDHYLALSDRTPVVRYLELAELIRPLSVTPPLRMLAVISSPDGYPPLAVDQEWNKLQTALAGLQESGALTLERLETPTLPGLQRRLRQAEYHIIQYTGHSAFDVEDGDGILLLEDETGRAQAVSGRHLGTLLRDHVSLRLALLNSCEGARTSRMDPYAGIAQNLVRQTIPAVVAMQFEITDAAAIAFAHEFYAALADGYPVDQAVTEGRKAVLFAGHETEWGTPVLYLRAPDARIFALADKTAPEHMVTDPVKSIVTPTQEEPERVEPAHGRVVVEPPEGYQRELQNLRELLARRRLVLFLGADLPETLTGLPSRRALADGLARRTGISGDGQSLARVAQQAMQSGFRHGFTDFIRTSLDTTGKSPGRFHQAVANLVDAHGIETIVSLAYDDLLVQAFQQAGLGLNVVVRPGDVAFIDAARPTLFKLFGDRNQPDTLVVTEQDQNALLRDFRNPVLGEIQSALRRNSVLFLGYDLNDPVVGALFDEIAGSRFQMQSFAVWPDLPELQVESLRSNRNLIVLDADPVGILAALL